jgi:hypothetical protein
VNPSHFQSTNGQHRGKRSKYTGPPPPKPKVSKPTPRLQKERSQIRTALRPHSYKPGTYQEPSELDISDFNSGDVDSVKRFVLGLDFGTTFTSVSYYAHPAAVKRPMILPSEVQSIMHWPNDGVDGHRKQIPTESWYSAVKRPRKSIRDEDDPETWDDNQSDNGESWARTSSFGVDHNMDPALFGHTDGDQEAPFLWGYDVFLAKYLDNAARDPGLRIERSKSMLVRSPFTQEDRIALRSRLDNMLKAGLIRRFGKKGVQQVSDVQDVIADFLTEVLRHTGRQLAEHAGFTSECPVSFVITVPVIWCPNSSRIFQYAMEEAIRESGFGTLGNGSIDNLFITTEPEAAATYLMENSKYMTVSALIQHQGIAY